MSKRQTLKLMLAGGAVSATWVKPKVEGVLLPAHASTTCTSILNASYSQSSLWSSGVTPATASGMTDGMTSNSTQTGTDDALSVEWVQMDFGASRSVCAVVVGSDFDTTLGEDDWGVQYTENCDVQYSTNGSSWTTAFNTGTFSQPIQSYSVDFEARYVRIVNGPFDPTHVAVTEFYSLGA